MHTVCMDKNGGGELSGLHPTSHPFPFCENANNDTNPTRDCNVTHHHIISYILNIPVVKLFSFNYGMA